VDPWLRASLVGGVFAGLAGLLVFTLLHVALVGPLWVLLLVGFLPAVAGGAVVGWAFHVLAGHGKLPARPLQGPAFGALMWLTLVPLELLALSRGPVPGATPLDAMRHVGPEVLLPALAGMLAGWALTQDLRASALLGLASLALALPVAGTLVALGAGGLGPSIFAGMLLVDGVAGFVLAEVRPMLAKPALSGPEARPGG